ncbi:hypothetical protein [Xenorhabdus stockiae]|nr:hypothetical protein [Xenorhabdus stockiae]
MGPPADNRQRVADQQATADNQGIGQPVFQVTAGQHRPDPRQGNDIHQ